MLCLHRAAGRFDASHGLVLIKKYLCCGAVHPDLAAEAAEALEQTGRELVAGLVGDPCSVVHIQPQHVDILQEGKMVGVNAEISPISVHYVLRELGHLHGLEYAVDGIAAQAKEIGEMLLHILRVCLARDAQRVVARLVELGAEIEKVLDGLAASGNEPLHLVDEVFHTTGQGRVDVGLSVACGGDNAEIVRHLMPLDIKAEIVDDDLAAASGIFGGSELTDLVQSRFKLEAAPAEA